MSNFTLRALLVVVGLILSAKANSIAQPIVRADVPVATKIIATTTPQPAPPRVAPVVSMPTHNTVARAAPKVPSVTVHAVVPVSNAQSVATKTIATTTPQPAPPRVAPVVSMSTHNTVARAAPKVPSVTVHAVVTQNHVTQNHPVAAISTTNSTTNSTTKTATLAVNVPLSPLAPKKELNYTPPISDLNVVDKFKKNLSEDKFTVSPQTKPQSSTQAQVTNTWDQIVVAKKNGDDIKVKNLIATLPPDSRGAAMDAMYGGATEIDMTQFIGVTGVAKGSVIFVGKTVIKEALKDVAVYEAKKTSQAAIVSQTEKFAVQETRAIVAPVLKTTKEATVAAENLGFKKINETIHGGEAIYKRGSTYITRDVTGHNGGAWKVAESIKDLALKNTRTGTYNIDLSKVVGD